MSDITDEEKMAMVALYQAHLAQMRMNAQLTDHTPFMPVNPDPAIFQPIVPTVHLADRKSEVQSPS